jgi:outer membrane protein assembly factor BamB
VRFRNGSRTRGGLVGCAVVFACAGAAIAQEWPQFAGGPQRLSASGSASVPRVGMVRWSVMQHLGQPVTFPHPGGAIVAGCVVYAVGRAVGGDAALAVDGTTGAVRWAAPVAPPVVGSWSTPALDVGNGVVIVGAGSQLVGLRVSDGSVAWLTPLQATIVNASPCLTTDRGPADRVLITDYAPFGIGRLYCINVDPFLAGVNPFSPGDIVWSIPIGATSGNTAAYLAGRVYVACVEAEPEGPGRCAVL